MVEHVQPINMIRVVLVAEALVLELVETVEKVETHNGALQKMEKKEKIAEK